MIYEHEKRENHWNNIKGSIMFLLIVAEILFAFIDSTKIYFIIKAIYLCIIPLFSFTIGYLEKNNNELSYGKLFLYYFIGNTILMWGSFFLTKTNFNLIIPYLSCNYLLSLIFWKLLIKYTSSIKFILPFSIIIALLIGFFEEINTILAMSSTICFFPFYLLGYKSNYYINHFLVNRKPLIQIIGWILLPILLLFLLKFIPKVNLNEIMMYAYITNNQLLDRIAIFIVESLVILITLMIIPKWKIPFVNVWGKNFMNIILYHGIFTLIALEFIPTGNRTIYYLIISIIVALFSCFVCGNNLIRNVNKKIYNKINVNLSLKNKKFKNILTTCILIFIVFTLSVPLINKKLSFVENKDIIFSIMSAKEEQEVEDAVSILFTGDLILLKEQVERAYNLNTKSYDFNSVFEYTKKYIESADLAIGVFEGPLPGEKTGYTTSNYEDGTELHIGFPDEFATAVKNAGFDLVTIANNHILDKGKDAVYRTIDVLNTIGLEYVGVSENNNENFKIINIENLKIGVLAYTYGFNYYDENEALNANIASILVDKKSKNFSKVKKAVEEDFRQLKNLNPDVIVVLPHMGTQFSNETDDFQKTWEKIFIENGANIILGDHTHSVQPIEYREDSNGNDVIIINSPGNFVNSYQEYYGDANAMVEIYIKKNDASIIGASVIPMWTNSPSEGNYQALPVYDIMTDQELKSKISNNDMKRINDVYNLTTKVMLNTELSITNVEEKLYLSKSGYKRKKVKALNIVEEQKNSVIYKLIENSDSVLFIGDSITKGSKNGGYGWYEPLVALFPDKKVLNVSKDGGTVKLITKQYNKEQADLYVIAIGTNDVRYRDKNCAMDENEYIESIRNLINKIPNKDHAKFVFIAPWLSSSKDTMMTNEKLKLELLERYSNALANFCHENGYLYINPNEELSNMFKNDSTSKYMVDYIHPNALSGINLYSEIILNASLNI